MAMQDKPDFYNQLIPFYGGKYPYLFEIERRCMDRDGKVIRFLDQILRWVWCWTSAQGMALLLPV
jgi:hypothetical protein